MAAPTKTSRHLECKDLHNYLKTLNPTILDRLYNHPATCLAVFRELPVLARHYVMRTLFVEQPVSQTVVSSWVTADHQGDHAESLKTLMTLRVWHEHALPGGLPGCKMNEVFRFNLKVALLGGGRPWTGTGALGQDKHGKDVPFLDNYAMERWECVLHYMVGSKEGVSGVSRDVVDILLYAGLMKADTSDPEPTITPAGFQFLLLDTPSQVWFFMLQYLETCESRGMDLVETLSFLFQLSFFTMGKDYSTDGMSENQLRFLQHLREFGLVYQRKFFLPIHCSPGEYIPATPAESPIARLDFSKYSDSPNAHLDLSQTTHSPRVTLTFDTGSPTVLRNLHDADSATVKTSSTHSTSVMWKTSSSDSPTVFNSQLCIQKRHILASKQALGLQISSVKSKKTTKLNSDNSIYQASKSTSSSHEEQFTSPLQLSLINQMTGLKISHIPSPSTIKSPSKSTVSTSVDEDTKSDISAIPNLPSKQGLKSALVNINHTRLHSIGASETEAKPSSFDSSSHSNVQSTEVATKPSRKKSAILLAVSALGRKPKMTSSYDQQLSTPNYRQLR